MGALTLCLPFCDAWQFSFWYRWNNQDPYCTIETNTDLLLKALKGFLNLHFTMSAGGHTLFATVRRISSDYFKDILSLLSSLVWRGFSPDVLHFTIKFKESSSSRSKLCELSAHWVCTDRSGLNRTGDFRRVTLGEAKEGRRLASLSMSAVSAVWWTSANTARMLAALKSYWLEGGTDKCNCPLSTDTHTNLMTTYYKNCQEGTSMCARC